MKSTTCILQQQLCVMMSGMSGGALCERHYMFPACICNIHGLVQVSEAVCLESLSYHEAWELSYFGASVLHPRTTMPAMKYSIPITIRNFFNRHAPGATPCVPHPCCTTCAALCWPTGNKRAEMTKLRDMVLPGGHDFGLFRL